MTPDGTLELNDRIDDGKRAIGHHWALNELMVAPRRRSLRSLGSEREPATLSYGGVHYR